MSTHIPRHQANTGEFLIEAKKVRRESAMLPEPLQQVVRSMRRSYLQRMVLDEIEAEVENMARKEGVLVKVNRILAPPCAVIPADKREDYLKKLVKRPGYIRGLRNLARERLSDENIMKEVFAEQGIRLDEQVPETGPMVVNGTWRFNGIDPIFETMNVGVASAIANWIVEESADPFDDLFEMDAKEHPVTVLLWFCGIAGLLALVLDQRKPRNRRFIVTEVDVFRNYRDRQDSAAWSGNHGIDPIDGTTLTPVVSRLYEVPKKKFEFVVLNIPACSDDSGRNLRDIWKTEEERMLRDPGRLSTKSWRNELMSYVKRLPDLLKETGQAVLLLPYGVRGARGYREDKNILRGIELWLSDAGLEILRDVHVVEEKPLSQPFMNKARPESRLIIVKRREA